MDVCAILGRGSTLVKYLEYYENISKIYLINNFNDELEKLGLDKFKHKKVVHVVGRGTNQLSKRFYKKLCINKVICNAFDSSNFQGNYPIKIKYLDEKMRKRGYPSVGMETVQMYMDKFDTYKELINFLQQEIKAGRLKEKHKSRRGWPTTSLLAIDLCLIKDRPNSMYLFGIDFYRTQYLTKQNAEYQDGNWYKSKSMIKQLEYVVREFKKVQFYSSYCLDWDFPNWHNLSETTEIENEKISF